MHNDDRLDLRDDEAAASRKTPPGICDTHMHVYGPPERFPGSRLEPDATFEHYLALRHRLGIERTVYVQPSAYRRDHACLLDALERDRDNARAIAVVGTEASAAELQGLDAAGVRGVRFHGLVPGCLPINELEPVARHVATLGWHVLIQVSGDDLPALEDRLAALPCDYVIDHIGRIPIAGGVERPAFRCLLRLLQNGRCWVKLSAPYEVSDSGAPTYVDCQARVEALVRTAPDRLLWVSNWPHPSIRTRNKPDDAALMATIAAWCGEAAWPAVAAENAARLYGFPAPTV